MYRNLKYVLPLLVLMPAAARAEVVPLTITFDGYVANDPDAGIQIRTYDPVSGYQDVPYTGDVPAYAYQPGDKVTFTLDTTVPSAADLASGAYDGLRQADGTYKIDLVGRNQAGSLPGGVVSDFAVSGPIETVGNAGQPFGGSGLSLYINPTDNNYSLGTDSGWAYSTFDSPGYLYDPVSGQLTPSPTSCASLGACDRTGDGGFALTGDDLTSAATSDIPIYGTDGGIRGFFSMLLGGSWSLPTYDPGSPTKVPEPSTLLLFGVGTAALIRRRRSKKA